VPVFILSIQGTIAFVCVPLSLVVCQMLWAVVISDGPISLCVTAACAGDRGKETRERSRTSTAQVHEETSASTARQV